MLRQKNNLNLKGILYHYSIRNIPICGVSVATMIHEYGHLLCSKILEFNGSIISEALNKVYLQSKPEGVEWTLFYLSGGLFQFIVFGLMSLNAEDQCVKTANRMTAIIGLIEGCSEPIREFRFCGIGAAFGIIIAFLYLTYTIQRYNNEY